MAWQPLESNPDVMNKFLHSLGLPENWEITDVYGLDPELLAMVPKPVLAVILLFPCSESYEKHKEEEASRLTANPQKISDKLFYMKQTIHNACGTIALVHSIANSEEQLQLRDGQLKKFLDEARPLSPAARGQLLEDAMDLVTAHRGVAQEGQTEAPPADANIIHHFVAFIHKDGCLYEMDGRKSGPINHGPTTEETLLEDAAIVCKKFMERDPEELRFTVMALTATSS